MHVAMAVSSISVIMVALAPCDLVIWASTTKYSSDTQSPCPFVQLLLGGQSLSHQWNHPTMVSLATHLQVNAGGSLRTLAHRLGQLVGRLLSRPGAHTELV